LSQVFPYIQPKGHKKINDGRRTHGNKGDIYKI
jgi:hypothetical protein